MNYLILLPVFLPFLAAIIVPIMKFKEKERNFFVGTAVIINLIIVMGIFYALGEGEIHLFKLNEFIDVFFKIDKLGILFTSLVSILWVLTSFYSMEYMKHEGKENKFFTFFIITLGVTVGIGFSGNLFTLYIFYEFLTLVTFPLVIHTESKEALESGKKYLAYSFGGATFILLGMILLFSMTNNLNFQPHGVVRAVSTDNFNLYLGIFISMFIGFGVKAALVPFHSWLPSAMVAPTPVSSLLHAVAVVKSGVFSLIRMCYYIFGVDVIKELKGNIYMIVPIIITILLGSFIAIKQENLKKRLAYSTVSQLGYILLGIVLLNKNAFIGALLHLINHAVIKITLFFVVGSIMYTTGKKNISEINGMGRRMPVTMWCFTIASISLIGIPPTNGFVSKWFLAQGGLTAGKIIFPAALLLSAVLTALYLFPVVTAAFFRNGDYENTAAKEPPKKMLISIVIITIVVVILGLFPNPIIYFIEEIASEVI
ncbi:Na(+)/H(+) antiporter subunit A [Clostridium homopropionicum DSM 5847]|uniref:Na(+)/H(+) antiporter subunit A n=1 Tax=Clostridium homopropionicum DSM 5847 TaxID=1121318 RepID=A0A0L6Z590_9CLOT|nr:proton-conducting transporter membrane subunit [Clostridium homopropionicum]KOA18127.1 Na(+)/H(+) antiporter subunit A [Clostridium homopropionicum DSM 5847]SFG72675.1 multisubunit sodium/proton antiporter, MrpD subunit [Clostridium homopropionicum]